MFLKISVSPYLIVATGSFESGLAQISRNGPHWLLKQHQQLDCVQLSIHFSGAVQTDYNKIPLPLIKTIFEIKRKKEKNRWLYKSETHKWPKWP